MARKTVNELHARWMRGEPEYRAAYEALANEFPETEPQERLSVCVISHKTDQCEDTPK